ncbi:prephenate dehydrogenase [Ceraceosorus bombacis]|uniref:Prephenate dehydrogenase n=1 Tax=Ceraceosorus bombacis TaxID=401625 RepID=A0A0P1BMG4_9BASI|nr:prephenate dehydrogenase [Ceraceosorus bombacis]
MSSHSCDIDSQRERQEVEIGIIGMGDMGRLYAERFSSAGWKHVNVCDRSENYEKLKDDYRDSAIRVYRNGHLVSRRSDLIIYSVEAAYIDQVVAQYGPSAKQGSIISGQTSVKAPERDAFERHLPDDVYIISCHSMHGPKVDPTDQPLILIQHRAPDEKMRLLERIMSCFRSRFVYLSYEDHDIVTANTQAATHAAFLSMGTAWRASASYPWETGLYPGGIETVKINICLRIYAAKWHVYAGLALLNPSARTQVGQYADSCTELFKLMVAEKEAELRERVMRARRGVFGWRDEEEGEGARTTGARAYADARGAKDEKSSERERKPILMSDKMLDRFHLVARKALGEGSASSADPNREGTQGERPGLDSERKPFASSEASPFLPSSSSSTPPSPPPNSHLALLAIVDSWHVLKLNPYADLDLAATPIFRLWIGVCEYLFRSPARINSAISAAIHDHTFRADDTEFVVAARGWAQAVRFGNFDLFRWRFEETREFFAPRFEEANTIGAEMLKAVASKE